MLKLLLLSLIFTQVALAITPDQQTVIYESYSLEALGKYGDAIGKMSKVLEQNPEEYFVHYRLGWLFSMDQKYALSSSHYLIAAKLKPASLEPWLALSLLSINLGDWKSAKRESTELLKRNSFNYYGNLRLIVASIQLKEYEIGLEKVNFILSNYPLDSIFLEQKAYILSAQGRKEEAKKVVIDLLLVSPSNAWAKSFMAGISKVK